MASDKKQGFASFDREKHRAASSKGGKMRGNKGFARLTPEQRTELSRSAAQNRWKRFREERGSAGGSTVEPETTGTMTPEEQR